MKLPFSQYVKAHHISHAALSLCAVVAALVFFVAGAGVRLLLGPVSLGPLQQTLAGAIQQALPGITLQYDKAAIEWDREQDRITLVVLGTRILDQNGQVVATAPKADIALAAAPFLRGHIAVQRITLVGVAFRLVHMKDGGIRLGAEGDKANDVYTRLRDVIQAKNSSSSSLKSFAVHDAVLGIYDEVSGLNLKAPRADLSVTAQGSDALAIALDADIAMAGDPHAPAAHVKANVVLPSGPGPVRGNAAISRLDLKALAADAPLFQPLRAFPLSTSLSARFAIMPGGHVSQTDFDLNAAGNIPSKALKSGALHVTALRLAGHYDGVHNHLAFSQASLDAREASLRLKGGADFVFDANGSLESIIADIATSHAALNMAGIFPAPIVLTNAEFRGTWHAAQRSFDVQRLALNAPDFAMQVSGGVQLGEGAQSPGLSLNGTIAPIAARTLLHYWPMQVAPGAREWIDGNIFAGNMGQLTVITKFTPGMLDQDIYPDDALHLSFAMSDVEGAYIKGLTHLTNIAGTATLTGDAFSADFTGGKVGPITVTKGHAVIPTLHVHGTVGDFTASATGALSDVMTLIDMKPLGYPTRFGVDPKQTRGAASIDLDVKVPMLANLKVDDVGILVKAAVTDFSVSLGKLHLTNGDVDFTVNNDSLHQTGTLNLADSRLAVDWTEDFKTNDPVTTRINVKGAMTDGGRAALNIGMASILTGPVKINADLQGSRGSLRSGDIQMDLTPSAILVPIVHLGKPAGQAATGQVHLNFGAGDNIADETMRITGPNLSASGVATFDAHGGLTRLDFPSAKLGTLTDLAFTLTRANQTDTYTLRGHSLDGSLIGRDPNANQAASPGVNASAPPPDETPGGAFRIDARLDRVSLRSAVAIAPFALDLSGVGNRPGTLMLEGSLTQANVKTTAPMQAGITPVAGNRKLNLTAGDAGMLIRGMFAFDSIRGGKMTLNATLPGTANDPENPKIDDYTGTLDIDNFTVTNQPFLTRLFSAGSLTGIGDLVGSGITVENLDVPFSSKNSVISVRNARAAGPAVGVSADGYIDRPHNQIALKGSVVPAYGINSVISNIPLIGDILASKKGEGILGVTYSATGNADQPNISTNPLAMLTPGILRRIFEGHIPTAANAPSNAVANAPATTPVVPPVTATPDASPAQTPAQAPTPRPAQ